MKKLFSNQQGMTLTETIIGVGVLAVSLIIISGAQLMIQKEMNKFDENIQGKIEVLSGEKIILFDIQSANISFNNIQVLDDNKKNFFDYIPEQSVNAINNNPDRLLTLSAEKKSEIIFLLQDTKTGSVLIYDPVAAYKVGAAPSDFNKAADLKFIGLNNDNFISNQRAKFWQKGQLLFLDTLARIRTPGALTDMSQPPRSSTFLGVVNGNSLDPVKELNSVIKNTHPETNQIVDSADNFLRTISSFGGGVSTIRVQSVKLIRYYLINENNNMKFYKSNFNGLSNKWENGILIADFVDQVVFQRQSVGSKIVNFKISKIK